MAALVASYATEWLDLVFRWFHVIAAIVWIGTSFYFVALDNHLVEPERESDRDEGVRGESWEIHGGGFYVIRKYLVAPPKLPKPLHWYKWEAYWTWLSGFALFCVLYYADARLRLIDESVWNAKTWAAICMSLGLLGAAWFVYDGLCRVLASRPLLLAAAVVGAVTATSYALGELFAPRAAYLQLGAMLGTIMAANVLFVIIPGHKDLVRAKEEGREPDAASGIRGKQRSVHNNYLTLPVLFSMLAGHFPFTYGHEDAWAVIVALMVIGAAARHYFNLRHQGRTAWWIPVACAGAIAAVAVWVEPAEPSRAAPDAPRVADARIDEIVRLRCAPCHTGASAPAGVRLERAADVAANAEAVRRAAVQTRTMPLGNQTKMTGEERELLGRWIDERRIAG